MDWKELYAEVADLAGSTPATGEEIGGLLLAEGAREDARQIVQLLDRLKRNPRREAAQEALRRALSVVVSLLVEIEDCRGESRAVGSAPLALRGNL